MTIGRVLLNTAKIVIPIAILAVAVLGFLYLRETRPQPEAAARAERVWTVATVTATRADHRPSLSFAGEVVSAGDVDLRPVVPGRVVWIDDALRDGAIVREGATLLVLDDFTYRASLSEREAEFAEARARRQELAEELAAERALLDIVQESLALARRELDRREELGRRNVAAEQVIDEARRQVIERRQQVQGAEQAVARLVRRLEQADSAVARAATAVARARRDLADTEIVAPATGILGQVEAGLGKWLAASERFARLVALDRLEVRFFASDRDFGRLVDAGVLPGGEAQVTWRLGEAVSEASAVLDRPEPRLDPAAGGVFVHARLSAYDGESVLRPGAFVTLALPDRVYPETFRLPEIALHRNPGRDDVWQVYVVEDGRLALREVRRHASDGGFVLVQAVQGPSGLRDGDMVVTTRLPVLAPGLAVQAVPTEANGPATVRPIIGVAPGDSQVAQP